MNTQLNPVAIEFTRFVLREHPPDAKFASLYDAMHRTAQLRQFRGLGTQELSRIGVSFSLINTGRLEALINEAKTGLEGKDAE